MSYYKEDKCGLYKCTKENRKGRMKLIARFKNVDNLLKWYDKNINEGQSHRYFVG